MTTPGTVSTALASFEAAVQAGRVAQAYLVVGSLRDEALPFAVQAVSRLFCTGMMKPCGDCPACLQVAERRNVDVAWVEPEKKSRIIGIDRIRDLQRLIYQTSYGGGWKAAVLVGADRMGDGAANAFLKTLEEPPPRSVCFLLTDSPQAMMATILSRCQRLILSAEPETLPEPWQGQLLGIMSLPLGRGTVERLARGALLGQLLDEIRKTVEQEEKDLYCDEQEQLTHPDDKAPVKAKDDVLAARIEARFRSLRSMALRSMLFWCRDLLALVAAGGEPVALRYPAHAATLAGKAAALEYGAALANLRVVETMQRQFDRNLPADSVLAGAANGWTA
jgi:DNA polymerase-3 subunit delta'